MATTTYIYNNSDVETQTVTIADIVKQTKERGSKFFTLHSSLFTPPVIYRKQLKMYRKVAQFIDRHPALTNLWIGGWATAFAIYIFLYY